MFEAGVSSSEEGRLLPQVVQRRNEPKPSGGAAQLNLREMCEAGQRPLVVMT